MLILRHLASFSAHLLLVLSKHASILTTALKSPADKFLPCWVLHSEWPIIPSLLQSLKSHLNNLCAYFTDYRHLHSGSQSPCGSLRWGFCLAQGYPLKWWLDIACLYSFYHPSMSIIGVSVNALEGTPNRYVGGQEKALMCNSVPSNSTKGHQRSLMCFTFKNTFIRSLNIS